jgi:hypothetical protein
MDASLRAVLSESERLLIDETDRAAPTALDEDAAIELDARIRRAAASTSASTVGSASALVPERGGRGKARAARPGATASGRRRAEAERSGARAQEPS